MVSRALQFATSDPKGPAYLMAAREVLEEVSARRHQNKPKPILTIFYAACGNRTPRRRNPESNRSKCVARARYVGL
jgi:hypothetical protein